MSIAVRELVRFENDFEGHRAVATASTRRLIGVMTLAALWTLGALPVLTWLAGSVALVHALEARPQNAGEAVRAFREGWLRHWRRAVVLGTVSLVAQVVLVANLLFLGTQHVAAAFVLFAGTAALLLISVLTQLTLAPVLVLFPAAGPWRVLVAAFVVAFRHPVRSASLLIVAVVLPAAAVQLSPILVPLCAPVVAHLAMRACLRGVVISSRGTPALR